MVFHFEHMGFDEETTKWEMGPLQPRHLKAVLGRWQGGLAEVGWNSLYWSNHDQPRIVSRFGDLGPHRERAAKALATVLHLHRGTPYVYQGEELGMTNYPFRAIEEFRDIESLNYYALEVASGREPDDVLTELRALGRDNARTPMQWDASPTAGFTRGEPWIAVNPNAAEVNAAAQRADAESVFHHYRRLHELRRTLPVVADGDFTMLHAEHEHLYAFTRCLDGDELLVLGNLCAEDTTVALEGWDGRGAGAGQRDRRRPAGAGTSLAQARSVGGPDLPTARRNAAAVVTLASSAVARAWTSRSEETTRVGVRGRSRSRASMRSSPISGGSLNTTRTPRGGRTSPGRYSAPSNTTTTCTSKRAATVAASPSSQRRCSASVPPGRPRASLVTL